MLIQFQEHITRQRLCKTTDKILLAVSGGIDSMVMLQLFHACGYKIGVAHCNFQLRGSEANDDELLVQERCHQIQVPFFSKRFETNNYATENKISIQMAARELRYAWFNEVMKHENFDLLATAHHLNDVAETMLLNLTGGRGVDGLTGIPVKHKNIIRPMLFALRSDIEKYAFDESITWREDASNQSLDYKRNRIRHDVIPVLKELNPNLEYTVQRSIDKNLGMIELMKLGIEAFEMKYVVHSGNRMTIDKKALEAFQHPASVLYALIKELGFSLEQCTSIITSLAGTQPGKSFFTPSHQLVIDRMELIITPANQKPLEILINESQQKAELGSMCMELIGSVDLTMLSGPHEVVFDAANIEYPLIWRTWREGDFFYPLGMEHKKKISDFLIDKKIARNDKEGVTVLESAGEIIWVVGYQISNRFKITPATKCVLRITVTQPHFI